MYRHTQKDPEDSPNRIEDICYDHDHIDRVTAEIKSTFPDYFSKYLETDSGSAPDSEKMAQLAEKYGAKISKRKQHGNPGATLQKIFFSAYDAFNKDRKKYLSILDLESLQGHEDDPGTFKNIVLKNQCPIIHSTLHNKTAKELDKFREKFNLANAPDLLIAVQNITLFADKYKNEYSTPALFKKIPTMEELHFEELLDEKFVVWGVIGGGIRSLFLHKLHPDLFPYRSREAVWALWYLSSKKPFGCKQDSEFLMIDREESITQQNYFYPYDLFGNYAYVIYFLIEKEAVRHSVSINPDVRFAVLDSFLSFVAQHHQSQIDELKRKVKDDDL
jgi:hypothetical protein